MMERIYLDNGSTSFPKAPGVGQAMADFIQNVGINIARGGYTEAYSAMEVVLDTRERLCRLFHAPKAENVVLNAGITTSLNVLLKGFLRPGDHVLTTTMEHNAVMRPLVQLEEDGVILERIPCAADGSLCLEKLEGMFRPNTKALVMLHASNVCGTLMPAQEVGALCKKHGVRFILDTAQSAGIFPVDFTEWNIDALAFAGHKGLLGPQGIGGFIIKDDFVPHVRPLLAGGTGSASHQEIMPGFMPDRFEAGTSNLPGIFGLHASLGYLEQIGIDAIRKTELEHTALLLDGFKQIPGIRVVGKQDTCGRTAVVSVDFRNWDNAEAAFELEDRWGIMTRCGLHCAPSAHKTLGTYPQGTVRFAPGHKTRKEEILRAVEAVRILASEKQG